MKKTLSLITLALTITVCTSIHSMDPAITNQLDNWHNIGMEYYNKTVSPTDLEVAYTFFLLAANMGYAPSQNALGTMYLNGEHVTKNRTEAYRHFIHAARQKFAPAQFNVACLLIEGNDPNASAHLAHKLLYASAQQRYEPAADLLCSLHQCKDHYWVALREKVHAKQRENQK